VALAWLLRKKGVTSILVGANKMAQLEDNLAAANVQLSAEQVSQLDELTAPAALYPHWFTARVQDPPVTAALQSAK
jgi:aryl-alcohol dehydrogenase-like predicted oxidoreductase